MARRGTVDDVVAAVRHAAEHGLPVAARAGATTSPGGLTAVGLINESGLERFEPQTLSIAGPPGGTLTVLQVVYPNVFKLTVN